MQVLLDDQPGLLGSVVDVRITGATRWSVFGEVLAWVLRCPGEDHSVASDSAKHAAAATKARARVTRIQSAAVHDEQLLHRRGAHDSDAAVPLAPLNGVQQCADAVQAHGVACGSECDCSKESPGAPHSLGTGASETDGYTPSSHSSTLAASSTVGEESRGLFPGGWAKQVNMLQHAASCRCEAVSDCVSRGMQMLRTCSTSVEPGDAWLLSGIAVGVAGLSVAVALQLQAGQVRARGGGVQQ